jgi:hypothetical protein
VVLFGKDQPGVGVHPLVTLVEKKRKIQNNAMRQMDFPT